MATFEYFENCTFCRTKIGSDHCLLPYQFTKEYVAPEDKIAAIMDVTEMHMHYGIPSLKNNFETIQWMNLRPTADEIREYSNSIRSRSRGHYSAEYQSVSGAFEGSSPDAGVTVGSESSIERPEPLQQEEDKGKETQSYTDALKGIVSKVFQSKPTTEELSTETATSNEDEGRKPDETIRLEIDKISLKPKPIGVMVGRDYVSHVVRDLVLAARIAYALHQSAKSTIKVDSLIEMLMRECEIFSTTRDAYKATFKSPLDGPRSISKEIVARHSLKDIKTWESGGINEDCKHCILNARFLHITKITTDGSKIEFEMFKYFYTIIKQAFFDNEEKYDVEDHVKFELEKGGYPMIFPWINSRMKYLEKIDRIGTKTEVGQPSQSGKKEKIPYPAIDDRLLTHIDIQLPVIIGRKIEKAGDNTPKPETEMKLSKFLFILASEFLRRNKGWHNENSFTTPMHLERIEESARVRAKPDDVYLTFIMVKDILHDFRKSYKDKYQKDKV